MNSYDLRAAMEDAVACDLGTTEEAVLNFELHAAQLLPYDELPGTLKRVHDEYEAYRAAGGPSEIPKDIVDRVNKEIDEYFRSQRNQL
jgi:hypothetical protein